MHLTYSFFLRFQSLLILKINKIKERFCERSGKSL